MSNKRALELCHFDATRHVYLEGSEGGLSFGESAAFATEIHFYCEPISDPMFDASFDLSVTYEGGFGSDTALDGERTIDVSCSGADCQTLATALMTSFPCAVVDAFSASLN